MYRTWRDLNSTLWTATDTRSDLTLCCHTKHETSRNSNFKIYLEDNREVSGIGVGMSARRLLLDSCKNLQWPEQNKPCLREGERLQGFTTTQPLLGSGEQFPCRHSRCIHCPHSKALLNWGNRAGCKVVTARREVQVYPETLIYASPLCWALHILPVGAQFYSTGIDHILVEVL